MKNAMIIVVFAGIFILFVVLFIKNDKRGAITITSYAPMVEMNLDDLIESADLIVVGDFLNIKPSRWSTANGKLPGNATIEYISKQHLSIFTDSNFQVAEYLKGDIKNPMVRIRTFGGQVGKDSMIVSGEPVYKTGQTYLLFLYFNTGATADIDPDSYYGSSIFYEIKDGKATSAKDEWILEELIAYIEKTLSSDALSPTLTITPIDLLTETLTTLPLSTETPSLTLTPVELPTETPTETPSETPTP